MSQLLSAVRKSFRVPKLEENVSTCMNNPTGSEKKRAAIWNIRDYAEKKKNLDELVREGVIPVMVGTLWEYKGDERLWALWVLRFLSENELASTMILQEPHAIEALVAAIGESNVGSEAAKRAVETVQGLSRYQSTQIMLARDDVFQALAAALKAAVPEATGAMLVLANLAEVESGQLPTYATQLASAVSANLAEFCENPKIAEPMREKAKLIKVHLDKAAPGTVEE